MRWIISCARRPAAAVMVLVAFSLAAGFAPVSHAQSGPVLAIDADASGNTATTLGQRDACIEVRTGDGFEVDVTTANITGLAAWEAYVSLDIAIVHVTDRDIQQLLSSVPNANAFDLSEPVPEGDGDNGLYRVGGANITEQPVGVDGSGVLARLTFEAVGPGVSTISVRPVQTDAGAPVGPVLTDADASHIGDTDGDGFFDGAILDAQVAVDQDCGADAGGPIAALTSGDDGGVPAWTFGAAALGIVVAAGLGGMALIRMRRTGSRGMS